MSGRPLFTLFGIPVAISGWHLLLLVFLFSNALREDLYFGIGLMIIASFSVLMHEMGHALVSLALRLEPFVVLTGFGGFTRHQPAQRPRDEFLIVAAGPSMNFLLAAIAWSLVGPGDTMATRLASNAALLNVFWGLYNLLPIVPLDGGLLLQWLLHRFMRPLRADRAAYWVGIVLGGGLAVLGLVTRQPFVAIILGMAAFENWRLLKALQQSPDRHLDAKHGRVRELLAEAHSAFNAGDYDQAMRFCHQARAEPWLSNEELAHVWQVLAHAAARLQAWDEALRYAERVPGSAEMAQVQAACLLGLGDPARARRFLSSPTALLVPPDRIAELQDLARAAAVST